MPEESAIREDVQNSTGDDVVEQQTEATERQLTPREEAMARIDEANQAEIERQNSEYRQAYGEPAEPSPTPAEGRAEQSAQAPEPVMTPPAEQTVRVKVDGVEMELPISEVVKGYQKDATASKRLEEASQRLREIEEREKALTTGRETQPAAPAPSDDGPEADEIIMDCVSALVEGETQTAAEKLTQVLKRTAQGSAAAQVADVDSVGQLVQEALQRQQFEREFAEAQETFRTQHQDLNENPTLASLVNERYNEAIAAGHFPKAASDYAVKEVRKFVSELTGQAGSQQAASSRQERKQQYDTITPAAGRVDSGKQQADDTSPAGIIAQMKAARGQA